jgi:hypothetical protein
MSRLLIIRQRVHNQRLLRGPCGSRPARHKLPSSSCAMMARPSRNPAASRARPYIASFVMPRRPNEGYFRQVTDKAGTSSIPPAGSRGCTPLLVRRGHSERTGGRGDSSTLSTPLPRARQRSNGDRPAIGRCCHGYCMSCRCIWWSRDAIKQSALASRER